MTQHCTYDEKLLDYLYEELSAEENREFSAHVEGCPSCRKAVSGMRDVRHVFGGLPDAIGEERLTRLTERVLAEAQKLRSREVEAKSGMGETGSLTAAEQATMDEVKRRMEQAPVKEGKVLPLRRRRIMSVLLHPATGVLSAAALALVVVMANRTLTEGPRGPMPLPAAQPTIAPAREQAAAAAGKLAKLEEKTAARTVAATPGTDGDFGGLTKTQLAEPGERLARMKAPAAGKKGDVRMARVEGISGLVGGSSEADKTVAQEPAERWRAGPQKLEAAPGTGRFSDDEAEMRQAAVPKRRSFAAPPADEPAARAMASTPLKEERSPGLRLPRGPMQQASEPSAPAPSAAPLPPALHSVEVVDAKESLRRDTQLSQQRELQNRLGAGGQVAAQAPPQKAENKDRDAADVELLLVRLREHIRRGQCALASETLNEIELRHPGYPIPQQDRLAHTRLCAGDAQVAELPEQQAPSRANKKAAKPAKSKAAETAPAY